MRILVTGANGFIGKNLCQHLHEREGIELRTYTREDDPDDLPDLLRGVNWVVHLAGVNRPDDPKEFVDGNVVLTNTLCEAIAQESARRNDDHIPMIYASSIQASKNSPYGRSKQSAEQLLMHWQIKTGNPAYVYRLPNVYGKWCKPHYNSAIATFCHQIARDLPVRIDEPAAVLDMVYIDDVVAMFMQLMQGGKPIKDRNHRLWIYPTYRSTVGEIVEILKDFRAGRDNLTIDRVGDGMIRTLYATYVSYLPPTKFGYTVPCHADPRGEFVEMLKTPDSGQFSFFTARPGVTRGGHYHHSKTEKFLVIQGRARFRFRHILTNERHEIHASGKVPIIVETVPGWTHDITNIGDDDLIVMLWANEVFDRERPDTWPCPL